MKRRIKWIGLGFCMLIITGCGNLPDSVSFLATETPTPTYTLTPSATPTATLTPTATPTPTATLTPTISADPTVYDNFENPANDGLFNKGRWENKWGSFAGDEISQQDGVIKFHRENREGSLALHASEYFNFDLNEPLFFEARLRLNADDEDFDPQVASNVQLNLLTADGDWFSQCIISPRSVTWATASCWDTVWPWEAGNQYWSQERWIEYGEWATVRIEVQPETMRIEYYIDDQLMGGHAPVNAETLKNERFQLNIGVWVDGDSPITGYVDDVRIGTLSR